MEIVAHRGARLLAVENTVEAIRVAWQEGADAVEFDVQLTADHELVVFHDGTLKAWTGEDLAIARCSWRVLREVPLVDERGNRGQIAHLDEVLEELATADGWFNLELKVADNDGGAAERLAELVGARLPGPKAVMSSFSKIALARCAQGRPELPTATLVHERRDWPWSSLATARGSELAAEFGAARALLGESWSAVHPHGRVVGSDTLAAWRSEGLTVRPWVVNEPQHWEMCQQAVVDGIITDDPGGLARFLGR